jgi:hypothetical protein
MKHLIHIFFIVHLTAGLSSLAIAQEIKGLDIGISLISGQSKYNRKYYNQPALPPGWILDFKSNYLLGAGIWGENHFTSHVSTMFEIAYTQIDVPVNTLCECNSAGWVWKQEEKHHWGSLGVGIRYYLNPKSKVKIFADGKLKGEWLIAATIKNDNKKKIRWDAFGYQRFAPSFEFAIGAKWNRLALNLGYQSNIARTFTRDAGEYDQVIHPFKTGILAHQLFGKLSYTVFKIR